MNKNLLFIIIFTLLFFKSNAQITLTTNIGNDLIETGMPSCDSYDEKWSKIFKLSDFGITDNDQFIIESGQVAFNKSYNGATIGLAVFEIDDNFPNSNPIPIGNVGGGQLLPIIDGTHQIIDIDFGNPIVIPAGVEKILVEVVKTEEYYNPNSSEVQISGTLDDTGSSWYTGCRTYYTHIRPNELDTPVNNANYFINVTGRKLNLHDSGSSITLSHNICDVVIKTGFASCSSGLQQWARAFNLEDFGISSNEELIINSGQIGIVNHGGGATVTFKVYEIDDDFPNTFSDSNLIGTSETTKLPYVSSYNNVGRIFDIPFNSPVFVKANTTRVLVVAQVGYVWGSGVIFIGGTEQDYDQSYFRGCVTGNNQSFTAVNSDLNFFINVTGDVNHISNKHAMNISNMCSEFLTEFSVTNISDIASIAWDFGDPASGTKNTSTGTSPFHDFSTDGSYTITAIVTDNNGDIETLIETIDVKEPPTAYGVDNIYACEDTFGSGLSTAFDTSSILLQVLGGQTNRVVTFTDGSGNVYDKLPNPFSNTIPYGETITIQVARADELCCTSEITFDLIVSPTPDISKVRDLSACDDNNDGYATFDIHQVYLDLQQDNLNTEVEFYHEDGLQIFNFQNDWIANTNQNQETITARLINSKTNCFYETTFNLIVNSTPIAHTLNRLYGCDDDSDGISEYFDISNIESLVLSGQTGMTVSYFDQTGNVLSSPLSNPYTNSNPFNELITVRVTDNNSTCYAETTLQLQTVTQPNINQPDNLYACNLGNGYAEFDTSHITTDLIGNQTGLSIQYYDSNNTPLPSPLPLLFQNTEAFYQTINVRVEDALNPLCYSETSFDLIVNNLPEINLEKEYHICNLAPAMTLNIDAIYNSYFWFFEDGTLISNTNTAELIKAGKYTVSVTQIENNIICENAFDFNLIRSVLPEIQQVNYGQLGNNFIEIIASGDGDFEYSIDGINYQENNYFSNISGGTYTAIVRDKEGCGEDREDVIIIDYPKFFTPNNDGHNDVWQIKGINEFPNYKIFIFDRYGKLLKQLSPDNDKWDGSFNGKLLMSTDYWFTASIGDGRNFNGHFTLKR